MRRSGIATVAVAATTVAVVVSIFALGEERSEGFTPFPPSDYTPYQHAGPRRGPLIGTNYAHTAFRDCSWDGTAILATYHEDGARETVHEQLASMRANGVESLRMIIWHMTDPGPNKWGPIPSARGDLADPYRTNLAELAGDVRRYGFQRLTVAMGPQWTNNPIERQYNARKLDENWRFLENVRSVVKQFGPADTRIDLINEGASSDYLPTKIARNIRAYATEMYRRYVERFGKRDVTVSSIAPRTRHDRGNRLQNLIDIFDSTGQGQPRWFEIHLNYGPREAAYGLRNSLDVLTRNGFSQPIVIGEITYDDAGVARALAGVIRTTGRVDEIIQWPLNQSRSRCNVSPPYRAGAYALLTR